MDEVLEYCNIDTDALEYIHTFILEHKFIVRTSKAMKRSTWVPFLVDGDLRCVSRAIKDVLRCPPDTSWMSDPPDLHAPYQWAIQQLAA